MLLKLSIFMLCSFGISTQESVISEYNLNKEFEEVFSQDRFAQVINQFIVTNKSSISGECWLHLGQYAKAMLLRPTKETFWAWNMFDAGTKGVPSGILRGNIVDLGNFDQCLSVKKYISNQSTIYGKYCLGMIPITKSDTKVFNLLQPRLIDQNLGIAAGIATCLPESCSNTDIQKLFSVAQIGIRFEDALCQSKSSQPKFTSGDIATISFLSIIFSIMVISTIYDVILFYTKQKSVHSLFIAFSVFTNGKKLITTTNSNSQIACLHGIRVISMMWIILGHRYGLQGFPKINFRDTLDWMNNKSSMFVMGATVSVDTFLLLSGILVAYSFMMAMGKGLKFNIIVFYVHRYLRLTPVLAVIILIYVTLLKHLGSGPLWHYTLTPIMDVCKEYWWSSFLYVQNYVNPDKVCISQSWYLSVDTQLFIISPLILIPLKKWPKIGLSVAGLLTIATILTSFLVAWFNEFYGFIFANTGVKKREFTDNIYYATQTRAAPWLMGIVLGYYIYQIKKNHTKIVIGKLISLGMWAISLTILCTCVFTGHNTLSAEYNRILNSFYVALMRPAWALGICWVIFACITGYGGPVNWFLSLPMFQVVSKLTYSMYLIHVAMQLIVSSQMRTTNAFSNLDTFYVFWGDFAFSFATCLLFTLAFESPIIAIENIIFGKQKEIKVQPLESNPDNLEAKMETPESNPDNLETKVEPPESNPDKLNIV